MKKTFAAVLLTLFSVFAFTQNTWKTDPMHSSVNFNVKHLGISFVQGKFNDFEGTVTTADQTLKNATFNFVVRTGSVNTGVEMRDNHLKGDDFFAAEKFPEMKFVSTSIKKVKGNEYLLTGDLTIKDVTKKVSVPVTFGGIVKNQQGKEVLGIQTKFTVNRLDYNIQYDPTGAGVGKEVNVVLFFELKK